MEVQEQLNTLISFSVMAKPNLEWQSDVTAQLLEQWDARVSENQEGVFWVEVIIDNSEGEYNITLENEEQFLLCVNKALGQELLAWRAEAIYSQTNVKGDLRSVRFLMNIIALGDIMSLAL